MEARKIIIGIDGASLRGRMVAEEYNGASMVAEAIVTEDSGCWSIRDRFGVEVAAAQTEEDAMQALRDAGDAWQADPSVRVINLTPHPVVLVVGDETIEYPPAGPPARVAELVSEEGPMLVDGHAVPLRTVRLSDEVDGLPPQERGTIIIVSRMVADARPDRHDLVFPHDVVRDENGRIVGCRALARVHY